MSHFRSSHETSEHVKQADEIYSFLVYNVELPCLVNCIVLAVSVCNLPHAINYAVFPSFTTCIEIRHSE